MPRVLDSRDFGKLAAEYQSFYDRCVPRAECKHQIDFFVSRLMKSKALYQSVGAPMGIPWHFIGIIHGLECSFDFTMHLHNGDPLASRTIHAPRNRPPAGDPPFAWRDSARDALIWKGYDHETDWTTPRMLYLWEKYNGFGYRPLGMATPYLWSFSNLYEKGKFVKDRIFDPQAVSRQCGAGVILKVISSRP